MQKVSETLATIYFFAFKRIGVGGLAGGKGEEVATKEIWSASVSELYKQGPGVPSHS